MPSNSGNFFQHAPADAGQPGSIWHHAKFDVWLYHKWWTFTTKKYGDSKRFLWLRNNGSTMVSQFLNTLLFTVGAFIGIYDGPTLVSVVLSSYVIFLVTSLLDTPVIYLSRKVKAPKINE